MIPLKSWNTPKLAPTVKKFIRKKHLFSFGRMIIFYDLRGIICTTSDPCGLGSLNKDLDLVVLSINVDLAIFQPYLDLEAGDNQSLKIQVPGIKPWSSYSASQELNHSATAAPTRTWIIYIKLKMSLKTTMCCFQIFTISSKFVNTLSCRKASVICCFSLLIIQLQRTDNSENLKPIS